MKFDKDIEVKEVVELAFVIYMLIKGKTRLNEIVSFVKEKEERK